LAFFCIYFVRLCGPFALGFVFDVLGLLFYFSLSCHILAFCKIFLNSLVTQVAQPDVYGDLFTQLQDGFSAFLYFYG